MPNDNNYGVLDKFLHKLALGSRPIGELLFDLEWGQIKDKAEDISETPHVFVSGLARAGTTIILKALHQTDEFRSLTYRDMPFVLAPNLWGRISGVDKKDMEASERAHGDGILVDYDSPEALEEVFWRIKAGEDYIHTDKLTTMSPDSDLQTQFRQYVAMILLRHPGKRYLSKNNNNILRFGLIAKALPKATILVPFRDPMQHAFSLMKQHQRFAQMHDEDRFSRQYMTWLVHHEFGLDQRPFVFDGSLPQGNPETDLDYWLQLWIKAYQHILDTKPEQCQLLGYERLCSDSDKVWPALCDRVSIPQQSNSLEFRASVADIGVSYTNSLKDEAMALYDQLNQQSL